MSVRGNARLTSVAIVCAEFHIHARDSVNEYLGDLRQVRLGARFCSTSCLPGSYVAIDPRLGDHTVSVLQQFS